MAGNRQIFEQAMRRGTNFAWERQWDKAIAEYERAVAEFPNEAPAYTALGQALVHAGRLDEALPVYQRAARLTPDDPLALGRVAELQERLGDLDEAVRTWLLTADAHLRRRAVDAAVKAWQHIVQVAPDTIAAHERLAKAYTSMGHTRKAVRQHLALAALYQRSGDQDRAMEAGQKALELAPRDPDVLTALEALQQGRALDELLERETSPLTPASYEQVETGQGDDSPVEATRQRALADLANALLEDMGADDLDITAALMQGVDLQMRGEAGLAISRYEKAIQAGVRHPAILFNLGLLYQEKLQFEAAVEQLQQVVHHPDYALGAHFALGECLRALGRLDEAVVHFIEALRRLDLASVGADQADELAQAYDDLAERYAAETQERTVAFVNALVEFLSGRGWEERLRTARQRLNRLSDGRVISVAEVLTLPDAERILASMVLSQEYLEQGMLRSASEECLWAIEHAPDYLPLHLHLAQLFIRGNQMRMAIDKYLYVASTLAVRGEMEQARQLYEQVLQFAPMDLEVRRKLIAMLLENGQVAQALEHQMALADAYYELAQIEESREQYQQALRMSARLPDAARWASRILHRLGDIDLQRLDWRSAIEVYKQLKEIVPADKQARQRLVELYFNLQRRSAAVTELEALVQLYRQENKPKEALAVLNEMLESRPEELELHKRAAQLCVEVGDRAGAVAHLDAMGELQLQAGRVQEAVATIKAIIALRPENVEAYRQLLEQIS